jgi:MFS family permease
MTLEGRFHFSVRKEFVCVILLLAVVFGFNLATSTKFPLPWQDEDQFTDVAANFALGQGFVSSVWTCGDHNLNNYFACNSPLYPYLLGQWIRTFGFSIRSARSLNYVLISLATFILWLSTRRLNLVLHPGYRFLIVPLVLTGYGLGINYRSARYDCLGILIMSTMLLAYSIHRSRLRLGALTALGIGIPFGGLQLVGFVAVVGAILLAFLRAKIVKELIAIGCGIAVGGALLCGFYVYHGVLQSFLAAVHSERGLASINWRVCVPKDPSLFLFYLALLVLAGSRLRERQLKLHSLLGFAIIAGALIPIGMFLLGKFPTYYSWMAYIPIVIVLCGTLSEVSFRSKPAAVAVATTCIFLGLLMGAPLQMGSAIYYWHDRQVAPVESLISRNVGPKDWVYTDYSAYFAVRKHTHYVFIPFVIPPQYRDKISVMVLPPGDFEKFAHSIIGGEWHDTGDSIFSPGHDLVRRNFAGLLQRRNDLKVYRRVETGTTAGETD